jgi:hypothetical protein
VPANPSVELCRLNRASKIFPGVRSVVTDEVECRVRTTSSKGTERPDEIGHMPPVENGSYEEHTLVSAAALGCAGRHDHSWRDDVNALGRDPDLFHELSTGKLRDRNDRTGLSGRHPGQRAAAYAFTHPKPFGVHDERHVMDGNDGWHLETEWHRVRRRKKHVEVIPSGSA